MKVYRTIQIGVRVGYIAIMTTRAAAKMVEQLVALLEKVDQQSEQLQVLTKKQAE